MTPGQTLRAVLSPPHRAGWPFIGAGLVLALIGIVTTRWLFWPAALFSLFCLYFFRDPERTPPARPGAVLAPADGRVVSVVMALPPDELGLGPELRWRVAIFLSVLNVHVNRAPASAVVTRIAYRHGAFVSASLDKASEKNERNAMALRLPDGRTMAVVQIAGLIARRILCFVKEGDSVRGGARFGLIRFGSRTDLYLPPGVAPLVAVGQTMIGGESVIAELT
jgi:phosphatidylserine decarboxylase